MIILDEYTRDIFSFRASCNYARDSCVNRVHYCSDTRNILAHGLSHFTDRREKSNCLSRTELTELGRNHVASAINFHFYITFFLSLIKYFSKIAYIES